ncbi:MAG: pyridoxal-dependent decarboxylase [Acidaminobacteraceae bacterium]
MNRGKEYNLVLEETLKHATNYLNMADKEPVGATKGLEELRVALSKPLNPNGEMPEYVINDLVKNVEGGLLNSTGGRFFAWVIGGAVPASLAADWLTSTWDQNASLYACSPAEAVIKEIVGDWLTGLLRLPEATSFALTSGCQMAHFNALAAARNHLLHEHDWDVEKNGLSGSPKVHILTNKLLHASVERAARFLGLGSEFIVPLDVNELGQLKKRKFEDSFRESNRAISYCSIMCW